MFHQHPSGHQQQFKCEKKDGTVRYCLDFREVNKVTKKEAFQLPNMEVYLDTPEKKTFMSALDMAQGYY